MFYIRPSKFDEVQSKSDNQAKPQFAQNISGGHAEHALSNIAFAWMVDQAKSIPSSTFDFDDDSRVL